MKKENLYKRASELIGSASHVTAFTGAGISVESGVPPFRGEDGLWSKYDPTLFDITFFKNNPERSWKLIKKIFFETFQDVEPNKAHLVLAKMEKEDLLEAVITQNIDNLHQEAGSKNVFEFHGNSRRLICLNCGYKCKADKQTLEDIPPKCPECGKVLKPDFVFFGEQIPQEARTHSFNEAELADAFILIGTTGEVIPAAMIPKIASGNGAHIIEINVKKSNYTEKITDVFLRGKATEEMAKLADKLFKK